MVLRDPNRRQKYLQSVDSADKEISTGKDFFIIIAGLVMVIMIFFLYRAMTTVDFKVIFPTKGPMVVDEWGRPVEKSPEKLSQQSIRQMIVIGGICFAIGIFIFVVLMILFYWPKRIRQESKDQGHWHS